MINSLGVAASQTSIANLYRIAYPDLHNVGPVFYINHEGIQYVGTVAYITYYVNIGSNLDIKV